jgi:hypothetical protein
MIKYIQKINLNLIENLVSNTVRTNLYKIENDQSNNDDYIDRKLDKIDPVLYKISLNQLINEVNPIIIYSNYRKLFNKTLEKVYRDQVCFKIYFCFVHMNNSRLNIIMILLNFEIR